jgi:hypothetical protein
VARKVALIGAGLSLTVSVGLLLRLLLIDNALAFVILVPAVAGASLASSTTRPSAWFAAAALTSVTALVSLFGFVGLLYVPSIAMYLWSASAREDAAKHGSGVS